MYRVEARRARETFTLHQSKINSVPENTYYIDTSMQSSDLHGTPRMKAETLFSFNKKVQNTYANIVCVCACVSNQAKSQKRHFIRI